LEDAMTMVNTSFSVWSGPHADCATYPG